MKIAVVGCLHGELDIIYQKIDNLEKNKNIKIDLVLVCGDAQTIRNENDYKCVAVPPKYRRLGTFNQYYFRDKLAPKLTLIIGGNHEASNYLQTLPYGGWVAPNMYYMGYCSVIRYGSLRIGGISGIFKMHHAKSGHYECLPYNNDTLRSIYHMREIEIYKLLQLKSNDQDNVLDLFMSHDWPIKIYECATPRDLNNLLNTKPFFRKEIETNQLGNPLLQPLVHHLRPKHWLAAHLHVGFHATVFHSSSNSEQKIKTEFQALDKVIPGRHFLHVVDIEESKSSNDNPQIKLEYDCEWLTILKKTDHLCKGSNDILKEIDIYNCANKISITEDDLDEIRKLFADDFIIPENFEPCKPVLDRQTDLDPARKINYLNPQTTSFCKKLDILDPNELFVDFRKETDFSEINKNPDEINLDSDESDCDETDQTNKRLKTVSFIIDTKGTLT